MNWYQQATSAPRQPFDALVLARCRLAQVRNTVDQQLKEAPWRTLIVLVLLALIWTALYVLLDTVFRQVGRWELLAVVANKHIFIHFFLVLAVMLAFSNAVLAFGSLYSREESGHLLAAPLHAQQVVLVKWLEGMLLSSWSFLLLGVPLMMAVAKNTTVRWYYYPLFIGHFAGFALIPSTLGLLVAWVVARWLPRRPLAVFIWGMVLVAGVAAAWLWNIYVIRDDIDAWMQTLFQQISMANNPLLPSTWTAEGIVAAMEKRVAASLFYLAVVLINALFLAWLTVNIIGLTWSDTYSRVRRGRYRPIIRRGWFTQVVCGVLFFYLPRRLRTIALKDVRGFTRDATQWTQMLIMMGLLMVYALNLRRLPVDLESGTMKGLFAFLNLATVSLILATFTSRFVFPLLSLESHQLWLLSLLPIRRVTILLVKFVFAFTITSLSATAVMLVAVTMLDLPAAWCRLQIMVTLSICVGLCGLSVGLGARFPLLGQRNAARIASGVGGTVNLVASMVLVAIVLTAMAMVSFNEASLTEGLSEALRAQSWQIGFGLVILNVITAVAALVVGARHFERLEV